MNSYQMLSEKSKERRIRYNVENPLPRPRTHEEGPCSVLHMLLEDANLLKYEDDLHNSGLSYELLYAIFVSEDCQPVLVDKMLRDSNMFQTGDRAAVIVRICNAYNRPWETHYSY